jgi:hypothetical protein
MDYESRIEPILGHLAWLAERIADSANDGRAYDAAVLTYNAAAMLQWYFVAPVSYADTIRDDRTRAEAAELIDDLVTASRRIVTQAKDATKKEDEALRDRLTKQINKVVKNLPRMFLASTPTPERMPELEEFSGIRHLMDEFLEAHKEEYGLAIEKGRVTVSRSDTGPDAALDEAIASLIYVHEPNTATAANPNFRHPLAKMAAGFFKTAVDMPPEEFSGRERKWWRMMADLLVAEAKQDGGN